MGIQITQSSFSAGEWGDNSHSRTDLDRYAIAAKRIKNWIVLIMGGVTARPGFRFIAPTKFSGKKSRLIPFQYNDDDTYILEFGDLYMRVFRNGGLVLNSAGPNVGLPFELVTPYTEAELPFIKFTQSANVMTLTHPSHQVMDLTRTDHDAWTITPNAFGPQIGYPTGGAGSAVTAGTAQTFRYRITAENADGSEEGIAGLGTVKAITGATQANPCVITATAHGFSNGDEVEISGVLGMTQLNGKRFVVANVATNTFELLGVDSTGYTAYISGGNASRLGIVVQSGAVLSSTNFVTLTWNAVPGASKYNVYKEKSGIYGYIASAVGLTARDDNINPEMDDTPPTSKVVFNEAGDYPVAVGYYEERRIFGGSYDDPISVDMSQVGNYYNFNTSEPLRADDAISVRLTARKVNAIRHVLPMQDLLLLTSGAVFKAQTQDGFLSASNPPKMKIQDSHGASHVPPLQVGVGGIFLQAGDKIVRDLGYSFESDSYKGNDINVLSKHRADGRKISDWCFAENPDGVVWAVLDDGTLAAMTYSPEYQITAWHSHDTQGQFESIASVNEGDEDGVYAVVQRQVNGSTVRYVERMDSRQWIDLRDAFFVDSGLTYDGFFPADLTISDATTGTGRTLTASVPTFSNGMVGAKIYYGFDGNNGRATITAFTDDQTVTVTVDKEFTQVSLEAGDWALAVNQLSGLSHLEGKDVQVFADKREHPVYTVASGTITLQQFVCKAHVGLGYDCDLSPLDLEVNGRQGSSVGKKKTVPIVNISLKNSRGIKVGPSFNDLTLIKQMFSNQLSPIEPMSGVFDTGIHADWQVKGQLCVRVDGPLPATVLALTPEVTIGNL